jgi:hypothetical protein
MVYCYIFEILNTFIFSNTQLQSETLFWANSIKHFWSNLSFGQVSWRVLYCFTFIFSYQNPENKLHTFVATNVTKKLKNNFKYKTH